MPRSYSGSDRLHQDHLLPSKFPDLEVETPLRANRRESCEELGRFFSHVPMSYPNTTRKSPLVYPLSMPVKGVDGKFDYFLAGSGFHRSGAPQRQNSTKTGMVPYNMYTIVVGGGKCQGPTPGYDRLHRITYSLASFWT